MKRVSFYAPINMYLYNMLYNMKITNSIEHFSFDI